MGVQQFLREVGGTGGILATSATGVVQTDNYDNGDAFDFDGSAYNYTLNPPETIQELVISIIEAEIELEINTVGGDTFGLPLASTATFDKWEIDSITFKDPNATSARVAGGWAGE